MSLTQPQISAQSEISKLESLHSEIAVILASASPRRQEILRNLGLEFAIIPSDIDETPHLSENPADYVERLAREKALNIATAHRGIVIGADTTVALNNIIYGKPLDRADAERMWAELAGHWHKVFTGIAVVDGYRQLTASGVCTTEVKLAALSPAELDWYLDSTEPYDKAGAYGIQKKGSLFVEEVRGNYLNVVGLPVPLLNTLFQKLNLNFLSLLRS
jgi:septum formation protein